MASKKPSLNDLLAQLDDQLATLKKRRAEVVKKIRISQLQANKKSRALETRKKLLAGTVLVACSPSMSVRMIHRHLEDTLSSEDKSALFGLPIDLRNLPDLDPKATTRRLIILGAVFLDLIDFNTDMEKTAPMNRLSWALVWPHFDAHLTRKDHRALFDLPPLSSAAKKAGVELDPLDLERPLTWLHSQEP
jgi:hypothetical protein